MPHFHLPNPFRSHKPNPSHSSAHKRSQSQPRPSPTTTASDASGLDPAPAGAFPLPVPLPAPFASTPSSPTSSLESHASAHGHGGTGTGRRLRLSRPGGAKRDSFGCLDSNRVASEEDERRRQELRLKRSEGGLFRRAKGAGHERGGSIPVVKDFAFSLHLPPPHPPYNSTYTPPPATPALPLPASYHARHQRSSSTPGRRPFTAPSAVDVRRMPKSRSAAAQLAAEGRAVEVLDDRAWRRTAYVWD